MAVILLRVFFSGHSDSAVRSSVQQKDVLLPANMLVRLAHSAELNWSTSLHKDKQLPGRQLPRALLLCSA